MRIPASSEAVLGRRSLLVGALALVATVAVARPALALTLDEARRNGDVGELPTGYIQAINNRPDVQALVQSVNAQRRAEYERIVSQTNASLPAGRSPVTLQQVEALGAQRILERLPAGAFYRNTAGQWVRR